MISKDADPENWNDEEEQRDEHAGRESLAMKIKPDELKELYGLDPRRAMSAVASSWLLVAATIAIAIWSANWMVWILAIIIVGRTQHAFAVLMHDAAHFRLLENRALNDFVGQCLCAFPIASNLYAYRRVHLRHHRYLHTDHDPDLSLSQPYPVTWPSFKRKLVRDATGVSSMVMRGYVVVDRGRSRLGLGRLRRWNDRATIFNRLVAAALIGAIVIAG